MNDLVPVHRHGVTADPQRDLGTGFCLAGEFHSFELAHCRDAISDHFNKLADVSQPEVAYLDVQL